MDINKFVLECYKRYGSKGVNMVDINVWGKTCSIYLRDVGSDRVFAHVKFEMPIDEREVFNAIEQWFK